MAFSNSISKPRLRNPLAALALAAAAPLAMAAPISPDSVSLTSVAPGSISGIATYGVAPIATEAATFKCYLTPDGGSQIDATPSCTVTPAQGNGSVTSFSFTITGLTNGALYTNILISAVDNTTAEGTRTPAPQTARPGLNPIPPVAPDGYGYSQIPGGVRLSWYPSSAAQWGFGGALNTTAPVTMNYEYECVLNSGTYTNTGTVVSPPATSVIPPGVNDPAQTYKCQIRTITNYGASAWINFGGIVPLAPPLGSGVTAVPTMGEWALAMLSLLLAASAVVAGRRRL